MFRNLPPVLLYAFMVWYLNTAKGLLLPVARLLNLLDTGKQSALYIYQILNCKCLETESKKQTFGPV
jgi:hypothetical protein